VAKVLGKALSWLIFSPSSKCLSQALRDPVPTAACNNIAQLPAWENPVMKIALVISGSKGELCLDELGEDFGGAQNGAVDGEQSSEAAKGKLTKGNKCWHFNHRLLH
jgi:hypothetical protein